MAYNYAKCTKKNNEHDTYHRKNSPGMVTAGSAAQGPYDSPSERTTTGLRLESVHQYSMNPPQMPKTAPLYKRFPNEDLSTTEKDYGIFYDPESNRSSSKRNSCRFPNDNKQPESMCCDSDASIMKSVFDKTEISDNSYRTIHSQLHTIKQKQAPAAYNKVTRNTITNKLKEPSRKNETSFNGGTDKEMAPNSEGNRKGNATDSDSAKKKIVSKTGHIEKNKILSAESKGGEINSCTGMCEQTPFTTEVKGKEKMYDTSCLGIEKTPYNGANVKDKPPTPDYTVSKFKAHKRKELFYEEGNINEMQKENSIGCFGVKTLRVKKSEQLTDPEMPEEIKLPLSFEPRDSDIHTPSSSSEEIYQDGIVSPFCSPYANVIRKRVGSLKKMEQQNENGERMYSRKIKERLGCERNFKQEKKVQEAPKSDPCGKIQTNARECDNTDMAKHCNKYTNKGDGDTNWFNSGEGKLQRVDGTPQPSTYKHLCGRINEVLANLGNPENCENSRHSDGDKRRNTHHARKEHCGSSIYNGKDTHVKQLHDHGQLEQPLQQQLQQRQKQGNQQMQQPQQIKHQTKKIHQDRKYQVEAYSPQHSNRKSLRCQIQTVINTLGQSQCASNHKVNDEMDDEHHQNNRSTRICSHRNIYLDKESQYTDDEYLPQYGLTFEDVCDQLKFPKQQQQERPKIQLPRKGTNQQRLLDDQILRQGLCKQQNQLLVEDVDLRCLSGQHVQTEYQHVETECPGDLPMHNSSLKHCIGEDMPSHMQKPRKYEELRHDNAKYISSVPGNEFPNNKFYRQAILQQRPLLNDHSLGDMNTSMILESISLGKDSKDHRSSSRRLKTVSFQKQRKHQINPFNSMEDSNQSWSPETLKICDSKVLDTMSKNIYGDDNFDKFKHVIEGKRTNISLLADKRRSFKSRHQEVFVNKHVHVEDGLEKSLADIEDLPVEMTLKNPAKLSKPNVICENIPTSPLAQIFSRDKSPMELKLQHTLEELDNMVSSIKNKQMQEKTTQQKQVQKYDLKIQQAKSQTNNKNDSVLFWYLSLVILLLLLIPSLLLMFGSPVEITEPADDTEFTDAREDTLTQDRGIAPSKGTPSDSTTPPLTTQTFHIPRKKLDCLLGNFTERGRVQKAFVLNDQGWIQGKSPQVQDLSLAETRRLLCVLQSQYGQRRTIPLSGEEWTVMRCSKLEAVIGRSGPVGLIAYRGRSHSLVGFAELRGFSNAVTDMKLLFKFLHTREL